jgi:phage shock protein C
MERRLYKSADDKVLSGVCGGIGEYFGIDPVIVRLLVVVFTLMGGAGLIAYIIAAIIIPEKYDRKASNVSNDYRETYGGQETPDGGQSGHEPVEYPVGKRNRNTGLTLGIILIALGGFVLLRGFAPWIPGEIVAAALFIGAGIYFIARRSK